MMANWNALIPDAPFDWALIPLDGRKRPIDPDTGDLKDDWQLQDGYDVDGISALNGQVHAVGLMLGEKSGGVLQVNFDGPASPAKFQEVYGKSPKDFPCSTGVKSGKEARGSRFFLVDRDGGIHSEVARFGKTLMVTSVLNFAGLVIKPLSLGNIQKPTVTAGWLIAHQLTLQGQRHQIGCLNR